jgi:sulfonate transport system ATP-binding protein
LEIFLDKIKLSQVSKTYRTGASVRPVFQGLELEIPLNKITVVVGRSGCGKSTLLQMLGGLEAPDSGFIEMPPDFRSTMLYPEPYLITWASVLSNITLSSGAGLPPDQREAQARKLMDLVQLSDCEELTPVQLSTGMKQRLALAKALASRSQLLLMDEPFASLDFMTRAELQQELLRIQRELPRTIVFVTHELNEAVLMADRILVFHGDRSTDCLSLEDLPSPRDPESPAFSERRRQVMASCLK